MPNKSKPNRLIAEKSPYLLQHAHNPVDWFRGEKKHLKKQNAKTSRFWSASVIRLAIGATLWLTKALKTKKSRVFSMNGLWRLKSTGKSGRMWILFI